MDSDFLTNYDIEDELEAGKLATKSRDFSRWSELPPELKCIVISYLDLKSKMRLSLCSKLDYDLVDCSPFKISLLQAREVENKVCIHLAFGKTNKTIIAIRLSFTKSENDTVISWKERTNKKQIRKFYIVSNSDYYKESLKFIEKWLKYDVESISVNMNRLPSDSISTKRQLGRCNQLSIHSKNGMLMKWWLERLDPQLKQVSLTSHESDSSSLYQFLLMDHFKMTDCVFLFNFVNCTDEQFLSIYAKYALIQTNSVTDRAINKFIHNWLNGKMREGPITRTIWFKRQLVEAEIFRCLKVSERESDNRTYEKCFQIFKQHGSGKRLKIELNKTSICLEAD